MYLNDVENCSKKKIRGDEVITNDTDINQTKNTSLKVSPKKEVNKFKKIDELDCGIYEFNILIYVLKCKIAVHVQY